MRDVYGRVSGLLAEILMRDPLDILPGFALSDKEGVTPMDVAKLAIACEKAFSLTLYDEKVAEWRTVSDACAHIEALLEEGMDRPAERSESERTAWFYE